jgi:hypothetical protein
MEQVLVLETGSVDRCASATGYLMLLYQLQVSFST